MKRPLAYITAAWCGDPDTDMELAARYCRMAYEAGFSPICPILYLPLFINDAIPEEHKNGIDMRRDMLRRSHVLVVCGDEVDEDVKNDIAVAKRLNITATTLDGSSTPPNSKQTNTSAQATVTSSDTSDAYEKLVAFKTANYEQQSVADFNQSLAPDNGDISGLLDAQAEVLASISPDDENYEFITMTLAASLDELYCEQMNDSVGLSAYLKREERPLEKLPGEESVAGAEITYQFVFNALYRLSYTFSDPTQITVADRDNALQKFKTEFQNYVDNLSEADLTSSNIKTVLSEKADELENSLSTAKMKLSCEVESVEVHNAGEEIVNN